MGVRRCSVCALIGDRMVDTRANYGGTIPKYYASSLGPAWFDAFGAVNGVSARRIAIGQIRCSPRVIAREAGSLAG